MKLMRCGLIVAACLLANSFQSAVQAGATLKAAALVVLGFDADNITNSTRAFDVAAMDEIPSGSVIFFTDRAIRQTTPSQTSTDGNGDCTAKWTPRPWFRKTPLFVSETRLRPTPTSALKE